MSNVQNLSRQVGRNIAFVLRFLLFTSLHFFVGLVVFINLSVSKIQNEAPPFPEVDDEHVFFACVL